MTTTTAREVAGNTRTLTLTVTGNASVIQRSTGQLRCRNMRTRAVTSLATTGHTATTVNVNIATLTALVTATTGLVHYRCELELTDGAHVESFPADESVVHTQTFDIYIRPSRA